MAEDIEELGAQRVKKLQLQMCTEKWELSDLMNQLQ